MIDQDKDSDGDGAEGGGGQAGADAGTGTDTAAATAAASASSSCTINDREGGSRTAPPPPAPPPLAADPAGGSAGAGASASAASGATTACAVASGARAASGSADSGSDSGAAGAADAAGAAGAGGGGGQSSLLYIHSESGRVQLRLPNDNVRLFMDPHLDPGILSVERIGGGKGSDDKGRPDLPFMPRIGLSRSQDDDHDALESAALDPYPSCKKLLDDDSADDEDEKMDKQINGKTKDSVASSCPWQDTELSYVLTVDEDLYRRLVKEMADSKVMCGLYYCCHQTDGDENRVNIGIALCVLFVVFTFLLVETIIHPH